MTEYQHKSSFESQLSIYPVHIETKLLDNLLSLAEREGVSLRAMVLMSFQVVLGKSSNVIESQLDVYCRKSDLSFALNGHISCCIDLTVLWKELLANTHSVLLKIDAVNSHSTITRDRSRRALQGLRGTRSITTPVFNPGVVLTDDAELTGLESDFGDFEVDLGLLVCITDLENVDVDLVFRKKIVWVRYS